MKMQNKELIQGLIDMTDLENVLDEPIKDSFSRRSG